VLFQNTNSAAGNSTARPIGPLAVTEVVRCHRTDRNTGGELAGDAGEVAGALFAKATGITTCPPCSSSRAGTQPSRRPIPGRRGEVSLDAGVRRQCGRGPCMLAYVGYGPKSRYDAALRYVK
jgi:hypothetical protein